MVSRKRRPHANLNLVVAIALALLGTGATTIIGLPGTASAQTPPPTLTGETLQVTPPGAGSGTITSASCNPTGTSTFTYQATGPASPPYTGTFSETGTVTMGPQNFGSAPFFGVVTSWTASFTISATAGATAGDTVKGTKTLAPTTPDSALGICNPLFAGQPGLVPYTAHAPMAYTATITVPGGNQYLDSGGSVVGVNFDPTFQFNPFEFFETYTSGQLTTTPAPLFTCGTSIGQPFNGTPISAGNYIWFSSAMKVSGLPTSAPATVNFTNQTISVTANGVPYQLTIPDSQVTFSPTATTATTIFASATNVSQSTVPNTGLAGKVFFAGRPFLVPVNFPGGISPVTWSGTISSPNSGLTVQWLWSAAIYTTFSADPNALGVKPVDDNQASIYKNSDHAGTPESFKQFVTGGATGGGGSNYTGSLSSTASCSG